MLPTLVLSVLLSCVPHAAERSDVVPPPVERTLETAPRAPEFDGFETDLTGFPSRRPAPDTLASEEPTSTLAPLLRMFLGVWFGASLVFGALWALLGWALGGRRVAAQG